MRYQEIFEDTLVLRLYHGGGADFDYFDSSQARSPNDFYGGGVAYFTDNEEIAQSYARAAKKRTGQGVLYEVKLTVEHTFDVDAVFTGEELVRLLPKKLEDFARGAGLMRAGTDKFRTLARLEKGRVELSGEQVFKGLSNGGVNTTRAREQLRKKGFDSLRYTGGVNMGGEEHNVYLPYYDRQITILNKKVI